MNNNNICAQKTISLYASNHSTHLNVIDEISYCYVLSTRITNSESREQLTCKCDADRKKKKIRVNETIDLFYLFVVKTYYQSFSFLSLYKNKSILIQTHTHTHTCIYKEKIR